MTYGRPFLLAASALSLLVAACSQPQDLTSPPLEPQYGTALQDEASLVATNEAGHLYTLGTICRMYCEEDYGEPVLKRFDTSGKELWSRKLGVQCNERIYRCVSLNYGLSLDSDGNSYGLYGRSYISEDDHYVSDAALRKYNRSGVLLWTRVVYTSNVAGPYVTAVATTATGSTFVAYRRGMYVGEDFVSSPRLVKYSSEGKVVFDKPQVIDEPSDAAVTKDGQLYIVGNGKIAKYSNDGTLLWQRTLPIMSGYGTDRVTVNDAKVYVSTNTSTNETENRVALYRYSTTGTLLWQRTMSSSKEIRMTGLSADASGNAYLVGNIEDPYTPGSTFRNSDFFSRRYTPSGSVAWTYAPELPNTYEFVNDVSAADSGKVYLVGITTGKVNGVNNGGTDAFLIRLSSEGKKVWAR